jgi:hypothetical protein
MKRHGPLVQRRCGCGFLLVVLGYIVIYKNTVSQALSRL